MGNYVITSLAGKSKVIIDDGGQYLLTASIITSVLYSDMIIELTDEGADFFPDWHEIQYIVLHEFEGGVREMEEYKVTSPDTGREASVKIVIFGD